MNCILKITFRTFTLWVLSSIFNGLICGSFLSLRDSYSGFGHVFFIFFLSLIFAAPGFFIFWIIMLTKLQAHVYERALFRAALSTGFILSIATVLICRTMYESMHQQANYVFSLSIIISAEASIMLHFRSFKQIKPKELNQLP